MTKIQFLYNTLNVDLKNVWNTPTSVFLCTLQWINYTVGVDGCRMSKNRKFHLVSLITDDVCDVNTNCIMYLWNTNVVVFTYLALFSVQIELMLTDGHDPDGFDQWVTGIPCVDHQSRLAKSAFSHCPSVHTQIFYMVTY